MSTPETVDYERLRRAGKRIASALSRHETPDLKDLDALPQITEFGNNLGARMLVGYFSVGAFGTILFCMFDWIYVQQEVLFDILTPGFATLVFCVFTLHFIWNSNGGRDCHAIELAFLLKCGKCNRSIQGLDVHKFVDDSSCPFCKAKIADVLPKTKTINGKQQL